VKCNNCGETLEIGSWPFCPDHGKPARAKGFEPYFDEVLGKYVTGVGDINREFRPRWEGDYIVHLQPTDRPASYFRELAERRAERARR
jgi:hypothetical protein